VATVLYIWMGPLKLAVNIRVLILGLVMIIMGPGTVIKLVPNITMKQCGQTDMFGVFAILIIENAN